MEGIFSVVFVILYNTETVSALKAFVGLSIQGRDGLLGGHGIYISGIHDSRGCTSHINTIETVAGNDLQRSDRVDPSQSHVELTLDNEPLFKYRSFSLVR